MLKKGYIHIYTGCGKGKTTAALGLALRAVGCGLKVFIAQFIKNQNCSEHKSLLSFKDKITFKLYGSGFIKDSHPTNLQIKSAQKGIKSVMTAMQSLQYNLIILDEINIALHYNLVSIEDVINILQNKPSDVEIVLTGRQADPRLIKMADVVTEMKEVKHYFQKGIKARKGIDY